MEAAVTEAIPDREDPPEKARQPRQIVELQPMTPHDRRIVHMAIAEIPGLSSRSEGEGEDRHILVVPAPAEGATPRSPRSPPRRASAASASCGSAGLPPS